MYDPSKAHQKLIEENTVLKQRIKKLEESASEQKKKEEDSRNLASVVRYSRELVSLATPEGQMIFLNDAGKKMLGIAEEDLAQFKMTDVIPKRLQDRIQQEVMLSIDRDGFWEGDLQYLNVRTGKLTDVHAITYKITDSETSEIRFLANVSVDITDRKQAEEALRDSEQQISLIVNNIDSRVGRIDRDLRYVFVNREYERVYGIPPGKMLGHTIAEVFGEELFQSWLPYIRRALDGEFVTFESQIKNPAGDIVHGLSKFIPDFSPDGVVRGFFVVALDITGLKQAEKELQAWINRYELIVAASGQVAYEYIVSTGHITWGPSIEKVLGYTMKEISGGFIQWQELLHPEDREATIETLDAAEKACTYWDAQYRLLHKRSEYVWIRDRGFFLPDANGKAHYQLGMLEDITEHKRSQEMLLLIKKAVEGSSDAIGIADAQGNHFYQNKAFTDLLGYTPEELGASGVGPTVYVDQDVARNVFETIMKGGSWTGEVEDIAKNGRRLTVMLRADAIKDENGKTIGLLAINTDITERKQAEELLKQSETQYRLLADHIKDHVWLMDLNLNVTYISPSVEKLLGYTLGEIIQLPLNKLLTAKSLQTAMEFYLTEMSKALAAPPTYSLKRFLEVECRRKDGRTLWTENTFSFIRDEKGKPLSILGEGRDITERKQVEEEKCTLEERLNRSKKMEALGQLAGGVAHDLNNVLGVLSGYSELLLMEIPEGQRARGNAEKILQSTKKGAAIIQDLLTLARRGVTASDVINLDSVVLDFFITPVFANMKDRYPLVTFRTDCDKNRLNIKGSLVHLEKTLMNLMLNAVESISGKGAVTIRTESLYLDKPIRGYDEIKEGDYVVLTVSDTGMGIPAEHIEKIFEPFYTKKTMGRSGTGLGLAIVWGTVKDHNGYIDVQSKVGEGTTFTLYFPVTREGMITAHRKEPIERYMGRGESVLVVDDIAEQCDVASGLLTWLGYKT